MTKEVIVRFALEHWKEVLLIALLVVVVGKFRYDYKQLETAYETTQQSLEEQIAGLQDIHKRELERRDKALKDYRTALDELERNYLESQLSLETARKSSKRAHIKDFSTNPNALIKNIEEVYGFKHAR